MAFPPIRTFIGFPYAATPTLAAGSSYRDIYWPLSQLVDGSGRTGWRSANTTGALLFDLGSSRPCNFVGVIGHNFDPTLVLSVQMADNPGMTSPLLSRGVGVKQPSFWLDLRDLLGAPTTARYLQLAWVANSRPVTLGEVVIGYATEFRGVLTREPEEQVVVPQSRAVLEYGKLVISSPGTMARTMELELHLDPDERAALETIHTTAATPARVVVVPSTHRNDIWYVDWPGFLAGNYSEATHDRVVRFPVTLVDEVLAVR